MKLAIGCDHGGFDLKEALVAYLREEGHEVKDFGSYDKNSIDYPDYVFPVAEGVARGEFERGIVICTTGIGPVSSSTVGCGPVVGPGLGPRPESRSAHARAPRSRRMCTPHSTRPATASVPHDISARGQPSTAAMGAVPMAASSEPRLSMAV